MQDKDKIIIVFYIDVSRINRDDVYEYTSYVAKHFNGYFDDSVKTVFVASEDGGGNRVECINPVLLNQEQYQKVQEKIDEYEVEFKKWQERNGTTTDKKQTD